MQFQEYCGVLGTFALVLQRNVICTPFLRYSFDLTLYNKKLKPAKNLSTTVNQIAWESQKNTQGYFFFHICFYLNQ